MALFQRKSLLEEKTVIVELGESLLRSIPIHVIVELGESQLESTPFNKKLHFFQISKVTEPAFYHLGFEPQLKKQMLR